MNPTMSTAPFAHGELRGSDDPRRSRTFEGRFGRMFRSLDPAEFAPDDTAPENGVNPTPRPEGFSASAANSAPTATQAPASAEEAMKSLADMMLKQKKT